MSYNIVYFLFFYLQIIEKNKNAKKKCGSYYFSILDLFNLNARLNQVQPSSFRTICGQYIIIIITLEMTR